MKSNIKRRRTRQEAPKSRSAERPQPSALTPKQNTKPHNFFKESNTEIKNTKKENIPASIKKGEEKKISKNPLHDYLTEDSIHPAEDDMKDKVLQLEVIEQNLKEIQGKCFMPPPTLKHFRYPSFGRGGLEKDGKQSTRRATSQDGSSSSPKVSEIKAKQREKSKEKPSNSKSFAEIKSWKQFQTAPTEGTIETETTVNISILTVNKSKIETEKQPKAVKKNAAARQEPKIAYSSLIKSLELRKNLPQANNEEKRNPWEGKRQYNTLNLNYDFFAEKDLTRQSIYSGGVVESPNKKVVDIYERNSRWLLGKDERIKHLASVKNKEEIQSCTFKPQRRQTGSVEKLKDELNLRKNNSEKSPSRNFSQDRRMLNSYKGIYQLKKGATSNQSSPFSSPKSKFFSSKIE